jgi:hypothetical protein
MLKSFSDFLSEDISYTRGNHGFRDFDVEQLLPQTLEELKRKTGLKKGDPVKFTGNRYLLSLEVQGESLRTDVLKGEDLNSKLLKDLKVRVDASQSPSEFFILRSESDIPDQEFTRTLKKLYNTEELLKMLRGKITGKKFGL